MQDFFFQVFIFHSEIEMLVDKGEKISIEELEIISDSGDIVDYIGNKFGFRNINSTPENQNLLKTKLKDTYISEGEARKHSLTNNGLVYLMHILFDFIVQDAYEYK